MSIMPQIIGWLSGVAPQRIGYDVLYTHMCSLARPDDLAPHIPTPQVLRARTGALHTLRPHQSTQRRWLWPYGCGCSVCSYLVTDCTRLLPAPSDQPAIDRSIDQSAYAVQLVMGAVLQWVLAPALVVDCTQQSMRINYCTDGGCIRLRGPF